MIHPAYIGITKQVYADNMLTISPVVTGPVEWDDMLKTLYTIDTHTGTRYDITFDPDAR